MKTIIMAGGKGTRIRAVASDIPKPMIKIEGKPVLEHEIECLRNQGFTDIILTVSYLGNVIMDYFKDGSGISPSTGKPFGVSIRYFKEENPLGNAGALFKLRESGWLQEGEDFLLLNADAVFDVDFNRFAAFHKKQKALATLFTHPNSHPYDSGLIIADEQHRVKAWLTKEDERPVYYKNRVNAGLHILNTAVLDLADVDPKGVGIKDAQGKIIKADLDRQLLKPLSGSGCMYCYDSPEYVKDMGTPERFLEVCRDYASGLAAAKNLRQKQRAIFMDRDGTINKDVGFLTDIREFELAEGAAQAVKAVNHAGYLCIVITNQPVVARGEVTLEELREIHNKMETLLGREGAYIDALYFCPHHPDKGFPGEAVQYKIECSCRKPKPGMLLQAAEDYHICLEESWMIGDSPKDIQAGAAAGCRTVLIKSEGAAGGYGQDAAVSSLYEAVEYILKKKNVDERCEISYNV